MSESLKACGRICAIIVRRIRFDMSAYPFVAGMEINRSALFFLIGFALLHACANKQDKESSTFHQEVKRGVSLIILGTIQDGGSPHSGCRKKCCLPLFDHPDPNRKVVSLGLVDYQTQKCYMIEATPDFPEQWHVLSGKLARPKKQPDGIFLSHAHIGHYTGLMYLGREVMGAKEVPVYVLPRFKSFLQLNGPWSQLSAIKNITLNRLKADSAISLDERIKITPFTVPHRDEYSETAGFRIEGPDKRLLFIPDIDKWEKWTRSIVRELKSVDYALLDATFFDGNELPGRNMNEIPHPLVTESMSLFADLAEKERSKVHFIHINHTNPVLNRKSAEWRQVKQSGMHVAYYLQEFSL